MRTKNILALGMSVLLIVALPVMPVSAHGHHSGANVKAAAKTNAICGLCTVKGCEETGYHVHDEKMYCGYAHECGYCDGSCDPVKVCGVEGCTKVGHHMHDDKTYCGYAHECGYCDGTCDAVRTCGVDGCTKTGHHTHDGKTYCGYAHESGYCDGTCGNECKRSNSSVCNQTPAQTPKASGGHHGHHSR